MPAFMKLGDIKGEATDRDHKEWILIESFSWGATNPGSGHLGGGGGAGKVALQSFHVSKEVDVASAPILQAVCQGKVFPKVEIHNVPRGGNIRTNHYMKIVLENCFVESFQQSATGDDPAVDQISIAFASAAVGVSGLSASVGNCIPNDDRG